VLVWVLETASNPHPICQGGYLSSIVHTHFFNRIKELVLICENFGEKTQSNNRLQDPSGLGKLAPSFPSKLYDNYAKLQNSIAKI
jgi:hypothetical protein